MSGKKWAPADQSVVREREFVGIYLSPTTPPSMTGCGSVRGCGSLPTATAPVCLALLLLPWFSLGSRNTSSSPCPFTSRDGNGFSLLLFPRCLITLNWLLLNSAKISVSGPFIQVFLFKHSEQTIFFIAMKLTKSRGQNGGRETSWEDVITVQVRDDKGLRVMEGL